MNGHIASAVAIVCAGNQYLAGKDIVGFWPSAHVFNFTKLVEFRYPPPPGGDPNEYPLLAADPVQWFATLKPWFHALRLHNVPPVRGPDQQTDTPDRMLAGFVGGGQRWLIEAIGKTECELWEPFHRLGNQNDPERRIWMCTHILQGKFPRSEIGTDILQLDEAVSRFRKALVDIEAYAREEKHDTWSDIFRQCIDTIDAGKPSIDQNAMSRFTGFDDRQSAIFEACSRGWVFGGMGSWNDTGGGERYEAVSQALYEALNDCIGALANATYRG